MTVMLELPPDLEERLRAEAAQTGQEAEALLQQKVRQMLSTTPATPTAAPRVAGLNRGQIWVSEDFDAPLPDEFWLGQE
jgi:plasmid stability protein